MQVINYFFLICETFTTSLIKKCRNLQPFRHIYYQMHKPFPLFVVASIHSPYFVPIYHYQLTHNLYFFPSDTSPRCKSSFCPDGILQYLEREHIRLLKLDLIFSPVKSLISTKWSIFSFFLQKKSLIVASIVIIGRVWNNCL